MKLHLPKRVFINYASARTQKSFKVNILVYHSIFRFYLHYYFVDSLVLSLSIKGTNKHYISVMQLLKCSKIVKYFVRHCTTNPSPNVRVRFAPSPTGYLHLGGLRTALYNFLFAKSRGGQFILRIEDTDQSRLVPGAASQLEEILTWIGMSPDESPLRGGDFGPYHQSARRPLYTRHAQELLDKGLAYRCFCTERRLELLKKEAARTKQPNKYDRKCYHLHPDEVEEKLANGVPHTIRFLLSPEVQKFNDLVYGEFSHDVFATEGDPVILKSDGFPTYHFANVVDDHLMEVTHVLRGVEWQVSTPKHLLIYDAFGWRPPEFGHLPLIMNQDGTKLSKRQGDLHLESLRKAGYFPESVLNFVTLVGGGFCEKENDLDKIYTLDQLSSLFNINKMNTHNCKIDLSKLELLNRTVLKRQLEDNKQRPHVVQECQALILKKMNELNFTADKIDPESVLKHLLWALDRITKPSDIVSDELLFLWHLPNKSEINVTISSDLIQEIVLLISRHEEKSLMKQLKLLSKNNLLKFPDLMKDLRLLLTGRAEGPPILELIQILGKDKVVERLKRFIEC